MAEKKATRQAYGEVIVEIGHENSNLVVMDADLSKSTMTYSFSKEFPDRFFNMGIAEQNLYATAAGIALSGKVVCASTFAMFAAGRAFEIIRNSIAYTKANVKICATHAGITVGEDGASHQTFEDIALMRTIPGMTILNPSDASSAKVLIRQAIDTSGPFYIRLGRAAVTAIYSECDCENKDEASKEYTQLETPNTDVTNVKIGKGNVVKEGNDITIIATGIMVSEAIQAAEELSKKGINARVIDIHTIKPIDEELILRAAKETKRIVTAEEHSIIGGLGSAVAEVLVKNCPIPVRMVGQLDTFGESGKPAELLEKYKMTKNDIINEVVSLM